ncbi:MAG: sigma-70 family RNA polymerase sigma factor [Planctomycetes bacterium]|nr:sigma-70 family RNA polymerase sigma factor [Planctomycetota bacterium]
MSIDAKRITEAIRSLEAGHDEASGKDPAAELLPMVYAELHRCAASLLAREKPGQTLQATALVHEAYLRVVGNDDPGWNGRKHFFAAAAEAMRRILINQARRKASLKHGGEFARHDVDALSLAIDTPKDDILIVEEALQRLEGADPRAREIVNLRYFAGFTVKETASALGLSVTTVEREWAFVRAWLKDALAHGGSESGDGVGPEA